MKKIFNWIRDKISWFIRADWAPDTLGMNILIQLFFGAILIYGGIGVIVYFLYKWIWE